MSLQADDWLQYGQNYSKCAIEGDFTQHYVVNQLACQQETVAAGHRYYSLRVDDRGTACQTAYSCDSPVTDTNALWQIFTLIEDYLFFFMNR